MVVSASEENGNDVAVEKSHSGEQKPAIEGSNGNAAESQAVKRKASDAEIIELDDDDDIQTVEEPVSKKAKVESPISDDPESKPKAPAATDAKAASTSNGAAAPTPSASASTPQGPQKKEPELTSSEKLLDRLEVYIAHALDNNISTNRKVLDALRAAINVQVQKEPMSVRKLILDKQLVLPNTISFPPSQVVDLLIEHDPEHSVTRVIQRVFGGEGRPKLTENERRERQQLKATFPAPHMTKMVSDIGFELVQEAAYADLINGRNLPEVPKNMKTFKQVASQLMPIWETLNEKNETHKLKLHTCRMCKFQSESQIVMSMHKQIPHYEGGKYSCGYCQEFDTNEGGIIKHYREVHDIKPLTREEPPAKNHCGICDEDFANKEQRDDRMCLCMRDISKVRTAMAPIPDHVNVINRWLWEKPPTDPSILNQQQLLANSTSGSSLSNAASSPAASLLPQPQQLCEICDENVQARYLNHLQLFHRQMLGKTDADMQTRNPLTCSRCRERFCRYEGLERHLVMTHGLVTSDLLDKAQNKQDGGRCKLCGKQYAFSMLQHLVADHDVKLSCAGITDSCDVCSFRCSCYQKMENHLSSMHPTGK